MRLHEEIDVAVPPLQVWEALAQVDLVASCIPGAELTPSEGGDDGHYRGWLTVRFGPKAIKFGGEVAYARDGTERVATITGRGQDPRSKTRVRTTVDVAVAPGATASGTRLVVDGDMEIAGPLASLVEAGSEHVARQLVEQFVVNLSTRLQDQAGLAADSQPTTHPGPGQAAAESVANAVGSGLMPQAPTGSPSASPGLEAAGLRSSTPALEPVAGRPPAHGVRVSFKMLLSIMWATVRGWARSVRRQAP